MVNPFLSDKNYDTETAIMLEKAYILDIGKAVAYTDGDRVFLNTEDNLFKILPAYDDNMLKWLLWHERMHMELRHHNRFFKYLEELNEEETENEFQVTKDEVNIIMDILVHDSMSKMFPELIETAVNNLAQFRNRNSLGYTFKTNTLEEMLDEYAEYKRENSDDKDKSDGKGKSDDKDKSKDKSDGEDGSKDKSDDKSKDKSKKGHGEGGHGRSEEDAEDELKSEQDDGHHSKTDWSKLDDIDQEEFIEKEKGNRYINEINELKRIKLRLAQLTSTLNGLVTSTKARTYKTPSYMQTGQHTIFKGRQPGKALLYLCFDASGSMGRELETFKDIIKNSIPQALKTPTVWFSGYGAEIKPDPKGKNRDYYKGTFEDILPVLADSGYSDDGDRTIELCYEAEQQGYSPIGVTDGGGQLDWSKDKLKTLKRTILVGQNREWLVKAQRINPSIKIIVID